MPLLGVAMAEPINRFGDEVYVFHQEEDDRTHKKYLYSKGTELVATIIAIILFTLSANYGEISIREMLISGVLGALLMFPMLLLILPVKIKENLEMLILNLLCGTASIVIGLILFSSWSDMQSSLAESDEDFKEAKRATTNMFLSCLAMILSGIFYLCESFIICLQQVGCS